MNFGNWIVVAFVLFAVFIGVLVTVCVTQDVNLVSKDYYDDELAYQDQIKRINNTAALLKKPVVTKIGHNIRIDFDKQFNIENGKVVFFCPSDPKMDKDFKLETSGNTQLFDTSYFGKGMYKLKLLWMMGGKEFYYEQIINI